MMQGIMEIQGHATGDPAMTAKCQQLMQAFQGVFPEEEGEGEVCD
jgi:hypothetical protein